MAPGAVLLVALLPIAQMDPLPHLDTWITGLDEPVRMTITPGDPPRVLVTDARSDTIARFDAATGAFLGSWTEPTGPIGIAAHPDGRIFVSRREDARVAVYDASFVFQHFLADGVVDFLMPTDMTVDPAAGRLYVVDSGADRFYAFDAAENLALIVGTRGPNPSQFKYPSAIAVNPNLGLVYVADVDNYRIQVFDTLGLFQFKFGYRNKYLPDGSTEGWMPRTAGLAVNGGGYLFVTDAVMGTLRIFDPSGGELGRVVDYGFGPGELRTPVGVIVDGTGRILIANTMNESVEVYGPPPGGGAATGVHYRGYNESPYDRMRQRHPTMARRVARGGSRPDKDGGLSGMDGWDPPHMLDDVICGRCHGINGVPGGHVGLIEGQTNLCVSCHSGGGMAGADTVVPTTDFGMSHAWGVPAVNAEYGSDGPAPDGPMALYLDNGNIKCATCHNQHSNDDGTPFLRGPADALCQECHAGHTGHTPAGTWQPTCVQCHTAHDPNNRNLSIVRASVFNETLGVDKPVVFTATTGPGSFDDGDPAANDGICQVCHTATTYHLHDGSGVPHNDGADCTSCHPHNAGFMPTGGSCIACHSNPQDNGDGVPPNGRPPIVNPDGTGGHHLAGGALTDADCVTCHEMTQHQQGTVRLWADPTNPKTPLPLTGDPAELVPFCGTCHSGADHPVVHATGTSWEPVCTQCHEMHDPDNGNLALVRDVIRNETLGQDMPVVFTALTGPGSFDDGDPAANDGVCQVCHTTTAYHRYDGSAPPHNDGANCTTCHPHASGFLPTAGSCQDCHQVAQGPRRPVVPEFAWASHHLQGAALDDADCTVCHDMSQHQQGSVRLRNVDDPAAVVVLTGDPSTDPAEATKLEAFCLACHDADGAAGTPPFTDGIMPAPVDPALWTAASHATGPMTCFGDGETFGCHSTGHGSAKHKLLAPPDASQPPVAGDPLREEEGMCYTCHDPDGPAGTDIETQFALATHHNVSAIDQADGSKVECVNCHNPHVATADARLVDPDTGGVWTGSGPEFCLACHDGAPPDGVSFPPGSSGSGFDKSGFAGTTHALTLGGNTCRHCHNDHGSPHASMLREKYVISDYNGYTESDYAVCWICHDATQTVFGMNAFRNRHQKHVVGESAPCVICHDVHQGFDPGEPGLINFENSVQNGYDIQFIDGHDASTAFWVDMGVNKGFCYLRCHGQNHTPKNYDRLNNPLVDCSACHVP